jgi:hypothetical protein
VQDRTRERHQQDPEQGRERKRHAALVGVVDAVHADHHELGIANPHHVDDAEDEVQAERQQCQQPCQQQPVDERLGEEDIELAVHLMISRPPIGFPSPLHGGVRGGGLPEASWFRPHRQIPM